MASLPKTTLVTYEEWLRMPESEGREEVVNGEIITMPPAKSTHAVIVGNLVWDFTAHPDRAQHHVLAGSFGVVIRKYPLSCRTPDVAIYHREAEIIMDGYYHSAPELVIEVLSPSETRCMTADKLPDYSAIGVPEAWVVSPEAATVEVLLLEDGVLRTSQIFSQGILKPRHFPHVQIDISRIWPD